MKRQAIVFEFSVVLPAPEYAARPVLFRSMLFQRSMALNALIATSTRVCDNRLVLAPAVVDFGSAHS